VYAFAVTQMPLDSCVAENVSDITSQLLVLETERVISTLLGLLDNDISIKKLALGFR